MGMKKVRLTVNGDYMRGAREALGMNQAALAEKIGVTESWIANIEGAVYASFEMVVNQAEVLGVPAKHLLNLVEPEEDEEVTDEQGQPNTSASAE